MGQISPNLLDLFFAYTLTSPVGMSKAGQADKEPPVIPSKVLHPFGVGFGPVTKAKSVTGFLP